ncbi:Uncharacterised protein [Candidatus Anstonella stagnisolia]|nr:Uncharacterised protein [Candidatus Anstonella stagnisolia]
MPNYASEIRMYLKQRPILLRYLKEGAINCSSLARDIAREIYGDKKAEVAVRAALLREAQRGGSYEKSEEAAVRVIRGSTLEVRTGLCVVLSKKPVNVPVVIISTSKSGIMSLVEEGYAGKIRECDKVIRNMDMIAICSGKNIENTPGVVSLILNTLAQEGINVPEITSCHYDTLLVVNSHDTQKVFGILREMIRGRN